MHPTPRLVPVEAMKVSSAHSHVNDIDQRVQCLVQVDRDLLGIARFGRFESESRMHCVLDKLLAQELMSEIEKVLW